jgi:6-phosphofructokinase 1
MTRIQTIGVLTSGGDAPGMNAAIRAVTRAAIYNGWNVKGIYRGWEGLINNEIKEFTSESVSGTINRGGTILRTARSKDFLNEEGRAKAFQNLKAHGIDALIVIGGNGSLAGAQVIAAEYDIPCVGLPGTIDNDLYGTDTTIGYDTALNTIMDCVDKIRDTANSHNRIFFLLLEENRHIFLNFQLYVQSILQIVFLYYYLYHMLYENLDGMFRIK